MKLLYINTKFISKILSISVTWCYVGVTW